MKPSELVHLAESRHAAGDFESAFDAWVEVNRHYAHPLFAVKLAFAAERLDRPFDAEEAYYTALALDPADPTPYIGLARLYRERKNHNSAAYWYRQAAVIGNEASSWLLAGAHERMAGRDSTAREALKKALELEPNNDEALYELALTYAERESDFQQAISLMGSAIAADPHVAVYHSGLGVLLSMVGDFDGSVEALEKSLELEPNTSWTWYHLGNTYLSGNRDSEARDKFEHSLKLSPGFALALTGLARLKLRQGESTEAMELLRQAIESDPGSFEANIEYGQLLAENCDGFHTAREHLRAAFLKGPTFGANARKKAILKMIDTLPDE